MHNAPNIPEAILGHEELVAICGRWPTFHDAEVLSIQFMRDRTRPLALPVCTIAVCLMGEPGAPQNEGPIVTMRFCDVHDVQVAAFDHQNPILGLTIAPSTVAKQPHPLTNCAFAVTFQGVHEGAFTTSFTCSRVEVVSIEMPRAC